MVILLHSAISIRLNRFLWMSEEKSLSNLNYQVNPGDAQGDEGSDSKSDQPEKDGVHHSCHEGGERSQCQRMYNANTMKISTYNLRISIWVSDHDFVVKIYPFLALFRGPICHFLKEDSRAPDNCAPGPYCPGPNLPLFCCGQLGPGQSGPRYFFGIFHEV